MVAMNLLKLFMGIGSLFAFFGVEDSTSIVEVSDMTETKIKIESRTYKEDFLIYPQVTNMQNEKAQQKINEILSTHIESSYEGYLQLKKEMVQLKEENKEHCKKFPYSCEYSYNTRYDVKFIQDGKLSIIMYDATYSGGAHGLEVVKTFNFNTLTGDIYTLKDITTDESKFASLTEYAKKYMKSNQEIFFEEQYIGDFKVNEDTQFYFTDNGIDLIFQQYEVAPYAAGHPIISIPSSEL